MAMLASPAVRVGTNSGLTRSILPKQSSRPTTLQRTSTLKRSIDETDLMNLPSSPLKRSRVTFDTDVDIVSADDEDDLDPQIVNEQVRRAIERHAYSDNEAYEKLKNLFNTSADKENAPSVKALRLHLQALTGNVSRLGRDYTGLVNSILFSEWIGRDAAYVGLFVRFLGTLAAAQNGYVNKIMGMCVDLLGPQKTRRLPNTRPVRESKIHRRVLEAIRYITQLVPTASGSLADRIRTKLNYDFQKAEDRMTYVRNFMELIQYVPELTSEILANTLRQLIKLDTSIQADLDEDDEAEDEILQHMSVSQTLAYTQTHHLRKASISSEEDLVSSSDESESEDEVDLSPEAKRRLQLKEDVKQVDMIMDILFQYYAESTSSSNLEHRDNAMEQLIAHFNSLILPTFRSRHPQFLVFHFAQADPTRVDRFVTNCIGILLDQRHSPLMRYAAAAYFSGFVGRGAHVSPALVHDCLSLLCSQLNELRHKYEPSCRGPDLKRFGDFYSIFQAIMYIFCFRWKDIGSSLSDMDEDSDSEDDEPQTYQVPHSVSEAIRTAIYSPLNPLRVCTPAIVEQFAELSYALQFLYIYPKIEENKRVRTLNGSWRTVYDIDINQPDRDESWIGENGMLEGYFPYDPYHLPISKHWIDGDYLSWPGIPGKEEEVSDSEEEDDDIDDYDTLEDIEPETEEE